MVGKVRFGLHKVNEDDSMKGSNIGNVYNQLFQNTNMLCFCCFNRKKKIIFFFAFLSLYYIVHWKENHSIWHLILSW